MKSDNIAWLLKEHRKFLKSDFTFAHKKIKVMIF